MIAPHPSALSDRYDLCVIGSGPAGMIAAIEFARNNPSRHVLLTEFGGHKEAARNSLDDSIHNLNPANHHDPYECTNKGLGGSSITWGGRCVMYDEVDFIERPVVRDHCTWDTALFEEVCRYREDSAAYFECGTGPFRTTDMPHLREHRIADGFREGDVLDSVVERWSMPTRFGSRYRREIENTPNLTLGLNLEARDIHSDAHGRVTSIEFRHAPSGTTVPVRAASFVIAAGTQETTRILLRNTRIFDTIGGPPAALGRYYQGHVSGKIASVRFSGVPRATDHGFHRDPDGSYFRRRFQLRTEALCRENLLNTAIWLDNPLYHEPAHRNGAMSLMYLAMVTPVLGKRLAPPAIANSVTKGRVHRVPAHILNVIRDIPSSIVIPATTFFWRYCLKRKLPGIFLHNPQNRYALHFHAEQLPDPDNRMRLADDGETLEIHYRLTDGDVQSVIRVHEILDAWLRECGCGELEYWFPENQRADAIRRMSRDGIHQSGTTRIAASPESGVVDRNLRVWGTENLHVCSSSVFPTSSQANPTFFLGMFAIRLARHLASSPQEPAVPGAP